MHIRSPCPRPDTRVAGRRGDGGRFRGQRARKVCEGGWKGERRSPASQSDTRNMDRSLWCNRERGSPLFLCPRRTSPHPPPSAPPRQPPPRSDRLSPHVLCLICQPKPSGPVGRSGSDCGSTSLFSHCISTPADINHGGSAPAGDPSRCWPGI